MDNSEFNTNVTGNVLGLTQADHSIVNNTFNNTTNIVVPDGDALLGIRRDRTAQLNELAQASRARSIERWQAAGVHRQEAVKLADDPIVGVLVSGMRPDADQPVRLLIGDFGAGKSLLAERLFQAAVRSASDNSNAPIPVFLQAQEVTHTLQRVVEVACVGLGDAHMQGATIVVDGADEVGVSAARDLLRQARILADTWPNTTATITSRPIPGFTEMNDAVFVVPLFNQQQALDLIRRLAGEDRTTGIEYWMPAAIKDAIQRPLFAVLLATHLQEQGKPEVSRDSKSELIASLVERAVGRTRIDRASADRLLQRLAIFSTDRGGRPVPKYEVGTGEEIQALLDSRLVTEHANALSFPLPIITQWFAAHSLAGGTPDPYALINNQERLERWRYALYLVAGIFSHEQVSRVLAPLAKHDPGFASEVVREGQSGFRLNDTLSLPSEQECARQVQVAMEAWVAGIRPLDRLIAPARPDGALLPLAIGTSNGYVNTDWYLGPENGSEVDDLSPGVTVSRQSRWTGFRSGIPVHALAWAWSWTLDELSRKLTVLLKDRVVLAPDGPLVRENAWRAAGIVLDHRKRWETISTVGLDGKLTTEHVLVGGRLDQSPIPLTELEERLSYYRGQTSVDNLSGLGPAHYSLDPLRWEVDRLRCVGEMELAEPWPVADSDYRSMNFTWEWQLYSDERILERITAIYSAALEAYQQLIGLWFSRLATRMATAVILPARLIGIVSVVDSGRRETAEIRDWPSVTWYFDPLPRGSQSFVEFRLGRQVEAERLFRDKSSWPSMTRKLKHLRPEASDWLYQSIYSNSSSIFFDTCPVTDLVYAWLQSDLERYMYGARTHVYSAV